MKDDKAVPRSPGTRLTELRRSSAAGKHGKTRKSQRRADKRRAVEEGKAEEA